MQLEVFLPVGVPIGIVAIPRVASGVPVAVIIPVGIIVVLAGIVPGGGFEIFSLMVIIAIVGGVIVGDLLVEGFCVVRFIPVVGVGIIVIPAEGRSDSEVQLRKHSLQQHKSGQLVCPLFLCMQEACFSTNKAALLRIKRALHSLLKNLCQSNGTISRFCAVL